MRSGSLAAAVALLVLANGSLVPNPDTTTRLLATSLIMGGTGESLIIPPNTPEMIRTLVDQVSTKFIGPSGLCSGGEDGCELLAVFTPEELAPLT